MPRWPAQQCNMLRYQRGQVAHRRIQTIAAVATALLQVASPSFKTYAKQVIANAKTLAEELAKNGYTLQTKGTDNHLVLWDLRPNGLTGSKVEKICDMVGITINSKCSLSGKLF